MIKIVSIRIPQDQRKLVCIWSSSESSYYESSGLISVHIGTVRDFIFAPAVGKLRIAFAGWQTNDGRLGQSAGHPEVAVSAVCPIARSP